MREIIEFLNETELFVGWINKETLGAINDDRDIVILNLALMITGTFIHEFLHAKYSLSSEEVIIAKTENKLKRLTVKQIQDLAVMIMEVRNETKKDKSTSYNSCIS